MPVTSNPAVKVEGANPSCVSANPKLTPASTPTPVVAVQPMPQAVSVPQVAKLPNPIKITPTTETSPIIPAGATVVNPVRYTQPLVRS